MSLQSPWDLVLWLLGLITLWVVASIPAHWFLSVWLQLRDAVGRALSTLVALVEGGRAKRQATVADARQELMDGKTFLEIDQLAAAAWKETLDGMAERVRVGSNQIETTRLVALKTTKQVEVGGQRLRKLSFASGVMPEIPSADEALLRTKRSRVAVVNLIIGLALLIPIAFANGQFTGLVIREVIPPVQPILGVPMAYMIAMVIVIAEAVVGLLHSSEAEKLEGSDRRLSAMFVVWSVTAIIVVGIETLLYAQVRPEEVSSSLSWASGGSAFALVGAVLGLSVFGLGRLAHSSLMTVRKDRTPRAVARQLRVLKDAADEWTLTAERIQPSQKAAVEHYERLIELCRQTAQAQGKTMGQYLHELDVHRQQLPAWARPSENPLTKSQLREREWRVYIWLVVALVATVSLAIVCMQFAARVSDSTGIAIGLGFASAAFAAGLFGSQVASRARSWRLFSHACAGVGIGIAAVMVGRVLQGVISLRSLAIIIPALAALAAGLQIGPVAAFLRLPILWLVHRLIDLVVYLAVALFWTINVLTAVVEYVARLLAWPTTLAVSAIKNWRTKALA